MFYKYENFSRRRDITKVVGYSWYSTIWWVIGKCINNFSNKISHFKINCSISAKNSKKYSSIYMSVYWNITSTQFHTFLFHHLILHLEPPGASQCGELPPRWVPAIFEPALNRDGVTLFIILKVKCRHF